MTREVFTVHTWRMIEHRFLPACSFDTTVEAWAWVRDQQDRLGLDISRFRVIASEAAEVGDTQIIGEAA